MNDQDGTPMFAFQDLDYIPFGFSGKEAPYIESGPGTMRAAATLMQLDVAPIATSVSTAGQASATVVCDLGCGDGEFRTSFYLPLTGSVFLWLNDIWKKTIMKADYS